MSPRGVGEMFRVTSSQISGFRTAEHLYPGSLADLMTPGFDLYLAGVIPLISCSLACNLDKNICFV